jgi:type I restriction enzyme S subunit
MRVEGWTPAKIGDFAWEPTERAPADAEVLSVTKHRGFVPSLEYFGKQIFSKDTDSYKLVRRGQFAYATIHLDEGSIDCLKDRDQGTISPMYTVFDVDDRRVHRASFLSFCGPP